MGLIPYGLNPDETWELDFAAARARFELGNLRAAADYAKEQAKSAKAEDEKDAHLGAAERIEQQLASLQAELDAYAPGTGPIFTVGAIPNAYKAEIAGERQALERMEQGPARARQQIATSEKIVRLAIRGHRNLRSRGGAEVPFVSELFEWEGRKRPSPARETLEAYGPILSDLALHALLSQRIDEAGKNG